MSEVTASFKVTILCLMAISGAITTIAFKFQNRQMVYEGQYYKYFFHPYMQAATMFFGEAMNLLILKIMQKRDGRTFSLRMLNAKNKGKQLSFNVFWLAIPAVCDLIASTLQYIALSLQTGPVYNLVKGGSIITTFIFSKYYVKMKMRKHHFLGSLVAVLGAVLVGLASFIFGDRDEKGETTGITILGYLMIVVSLFLISFVYTFQEKILKKYHIQPMEMVGYEGAFGLTFQIIILIVVSYIPCNFGIEACVITQSGMAFLQSPVSYFKEVVSNGFLLMFGILGIFLITNYNVSGVTVTMYINALTRSVCDVTRVVFVWIIDIIVTLTAGDSRPNYKWQFISAGSVVLKLFGFALLIFGNLILNKIVSVPCLQSKEQLNSIPEQEDNVLVSQAAITKSQSLLSN